MLHTHHPYGRRRNGDGSKSGRNRDENDLRKLIIPFLGEKIYIQASGEPIGERVTMASAILVMQNWGEEYKDSLELSRMELGLLAG